MNHGEHGGHGGRKRQEGKQDRRAAGSPLFRPLSPPVPPVLPVVHHSHAVARRRRSPDIHPPGDRLDALVAMNPAALKTNPPDLEPGGILLVNQDAFTAADLAKAGYAANPLEDRSLQPYRLVAVPMTRLNRESLAGLKL